MASLDEKSDYELEAGVPLIGDADNSASEKVLDGGVAHPVPRHTTRKSCLRHVVLLLAACTFITFGIASFSGVKLFSCSHAHKGQVRPEFATDKTADDASNLSQLRKLLRAYCPEMFQQAGNNADEYVQVDVASLESGPADEVRIEAESTAAVLDRRQDGGNTTASLGEATTSSEEVRSTTTSVPEESTTSQPPPAVDTTTSTEPSTGPSTSSETTRNVPTTSDASTTEPTATSTSEQETTTSRRTTTSERPTSSDAETTSSEDSSEAGSSTSRRTITTGSITTTSAARHTFTTTLPDGVATTITSTSWVDVVPPAQTEDTDPDLQNSALQSRGQMALQVAMGVVVGGILMA